MRRARAILNLDQLFHPSGGRGFALGLCAAGVLAAVGSFVYCARPDPAMEVCNRRSFVCSQTHRVFSCELVAGMKVPVFSPFTGKSNGFPAELCGWNADGSVRKEAVPVILNEYLGRRGPTVCPECGRLVVLHNPVARVGNAPPPLVGGAAASQSAGSR